MSETKYAGFWVRFIASFVDTLVLALPVGVIIYFLSDGSWFDFELYREQLAYAMSGNAEKALNSQPAMSAKWELLFEVVVLLITLLFWKKFKGATPGKKFVHIKIVDADTLDDLSAKQAIIRSVGYIASIIPLCLGFVMIGFTKKNQGLHDKLAKTVVIYED